MGRQSKIRNTHTANNANGYKLKESRKSCKSHNTKKEHLLLGLFERTYVGLQLLFSCF